VRAKCTRELQIENCKMQNANLFGGRRFHIARLVLALVCTPGVLIYAWGRVLVYGMLLGRPERFFIVLLVAGIGGVIALTAGLSASLRSTRLDRYVIAGVPALWVAVTCILIGLRFGDSMPIFVAGPLFLLATLWVVWAAWMFYRPWTWRVRMSGLLALIPFAVAFPVLIRFDSLTGEARANFVWRHVPVVDHGAVLPTSPARDAGVAPADLTRTSDTDYPQFLGPDRTGIIADAGLSDDWTANPPRQVWRKPVGAAWSSFAVVGDYAVTQEQRGTDECVVCYRLTDGETVWLHSDKARFDSSMGGPGPRATPTVADGRVYSVGGTGILNCLDGATGERLWSVDILKDNDGEMINHGVCGSPLVVDDRLIVAPTGAGSRCLAAYDRESGKRLWQGGAHRASYGSPAVAELAGIRQLLIVTADGVEGNDLDTGMPLWSYTWTNPDTPVNCSQPIVVNAEAGRVLFCSGYGTGSVLLEAARTGNSGWMTRAVWMSPGKMKTKFTTAVQYNGFAYGLDDGILACLDLATGKQVWKKGRYQHGQILLAGDRLIVQTEGGGVVLVKPDPKDLIELGSLPALSSKTWNNPVLAGRMLLVRNDQEAACYELPAGAND
jgi:outer membrane protein assembly factor BamB